MAPFPSSYHIITVHGLNTPPTFLNHQLQEIGVPSSCISNISLTGHENTSLAILKKFQQITIEQWEEDFLTQLSKYIERHSGKHIILICFSLGGLLWLQNHQNFISCQNLSCICLAPPLYFSSLTKLVQVFFPFKWIKLKSRNKSSQRVHSYTPIKAYQVLFQLNRKCKPKKLTNTTIVLDINDELIHSKKIIKMYANACIVLSKKDNMTYHHTIFDNHASYLNTLLLTIINKKMSL